MDAPDGEPSQLPPPDPDLAVRPTLPAKGEGVRAAPLTPPPFTGEVRRAKRGAEGVRRLTYRLTDAIHSA